MKRVFLSVAAVVVMGCGQGAGGEAGERGPQGPAGPAGEPAAVAGERLAPLTFVGDDGSHGVIGWHDTEIDEDCDLVRLRDGSAQCLPEGRWTVTDYYADPECKTPLLFVNKAGPWIQAIVDARHQGVFNATGATAPADQPRYKWTAPCATCDSFEGGPWCVAENILLCGDGDCAILSDPAEYPSGTVQ